MRLFVAIMTMWIAMTGANLRADEGPVQTTPQIAEEAAADHEKTPNGDVSSSEYETRKVTWSASYNSGVRETLQTACADCHSGEVAEGSFNLEQFSPESDATLIRRIGEVVSLREMPPAGSDPLEEEAKNAVVAWTRGRPTEIRCDRIASDETAPWYRGYVMSRRLTRAEYNNCIRDLTGLDLRLADEFPADGSGGEGFDTHGATLFTSAILMEKLLDAADTCVETVVPDSGFGLTSEQLAARRRLLPFEPNKGATAEEQTAVARQVMEQFAEQAWRRPVTADEVDRLVGLYAAGRDSGRDFTPAVKLSLKAILLSPHFFFVAETVPESSASEIQRITGPEMAQRLAMFLWSTMPDRELRELAGTEAIFQDDVLRGQVRRMLRDVRSRGLAENFGLQWLDLTDLTSLVHPDPAAFPEWDPVLAESMREEAVRTLHSALTENRSLRELIDSDEAHLNDRLAAHYGIEGVEGDHFRRVALKPGSPFGGVATLGGTLTKTSYPHRTSPVLRGKWLMETLLGRSVPPPPAGVPELEESVATHAATFRERLEQHRRDPACAACHATMDPLGFGLENFDAVGRWRSEDGGVPVDASGTLPDGTVFDGPAQLKIALLERRDQLARNLSRKLLGYALGRELNEFDDCVIDRCVNALESNDDRLAFLVEEIVVSYPFQHRYFKR